MEEEEKSGFRVKDSRRFTAEGEQRSDAPAEEERAGTGEVRGESFVARDGEDEHGPLPEMNFSTFVLSMHASAAMHMGLVADPQTGQALPVQLPLAQQTIDILSMMEQKTKGNLTQEEEQLLGGVLYELRMLFLEQRKKHG